jgi:hypothetical protein
MSRFAGLPSSEIQAAFSNGNPLVLPTVSNSSMGRIISLKNCLKVARCAGGRRVSGSNEIHDRNSPAVTYYTGAKRTTVTVGVVYRHR